MDWIYNHYPYKIKPKVGEQVLCDLGKKHPYIVLKYEGHNQYTVPKQMGDTSITMYYTSTEIKRWCHLPEHCDSQF